MALEPFTLDALDRLLATEGGPHVSIYLPPPEPLVDLSQDRIRLENLARQAEETLTNFWMPETEAKAFLKPMQALANDPILLTPRTHGVAIFHCDDFLEMYLATDITQEKLIIGRTFHVRPLLPSLEHLTSYFVLTLSQKQVTLFAGTPHTLERLSPANWPEAFLKFQESFEQEPGHQIHSAASAAIGKKGKAHHGYGGPSDVEKGELLQYLLLVDDAICSYLHEQHGAPLLLAGVENLTSMYQSISDYGSLLDATIGGNVDHLSTQELRLKALPIVDAELSRRRERLASQIRERDRPTATDAEQILVAAAQGRINTLFIDRDAMLYGMYDPDRQFLKVLHHEPSGIPGDACHDLIELAAVQTIESGGTVHAVKAEEMPVPKKMAAALRY